MNRIDALIQTLPRGKVTWDFAFARNPPERVSTPIESTSGRAQKWHKTQEPTANVATGEAADLGVAERFPERAAFECEWKQGQDGCSNCNHDGPDTLDPSIGQGTFEWLSLFVHLLNEIEEHEFITQPKEK